MSEPTEDLTSKTIADFGEQWISYRENPGYWGSVSLLEDFFRPLLTLRCHHCRYRRLACHVPQVRPPLLRRIIH